MRPSNVFRTVEYKHRPETIGAFMDRPSEHHDDNDAAITNEAEFLNSWNTWHGMHAVFPVVLDAVTMKTGHVNGWAALAVGRGVQDASDRLHATLETYELICGLLLSASVPIFINPPNSIVALPSTSWMKMLYSVSVGISCVAHFGTLMLGSLFCAALRSAVRDADMYRIISNFGSTPPMLFQLFSFGNVLLVAGMATVVMQDYYWSAGLVFWFLVAGSCGGLVYMKSIKFQEQGHVVRGWCAGKYGEAFDLSIGLARLKRLASLDKAYLEMRAAGGLVDLQVLKQAADAAIHTSSGKLDLSVPLMTNYVEGCGSVELQSVATTVAGNGIITASSALTGARLGQKVTPTAD